MDILLVLHTLSCEFIHVGEDFILTGLSLTFTPSDLTERIVVEFISDASFEGQEYVTISLSPVDSTIVITGESNFTFVINDSAVDPCTPTPCHPRALCSIVDDGMNVSCNCTPPYDGDGYANCSLPDPCLSSPCHPNATCMPVNDTDPGGSTMGTVSSSHSRMSNSSSGDGLMGVELDGVVCFCDTPHVGDGVESCDLPDPCDSNPCDENASCERIIDEDSQEVDFNCSCNSTFVGDGFTCSREFLS